MDVDRNQGRSEADTNDDDDEEIDEDTVSDVDEDEEEEETAAKEEETRRESPRPPMAFSRARRQSVSAETFQKQFAYPDEEKVIFFF